MSVDMFREPWGGCALINGVASCWGMQIELGNGDLSTSTPAPPNLSCP